MKTGDYKIEHTLFAKKYRGNGGMRIFKIPENAERVYAMRISTFEKIELSHKKGKAQVPAGFNKFLRKFIIWAKREDTPPLKKDY